MKVFILSIILSISTQSVFANSVCDILDRSLPGPVDIKVEISSLSIVKELTGNISKKAQALYAITTEDGSTNFTLTSKGSGEAITCRISVEAGMEGDLIDMNLEKGHFVFSDESNIKLTVNKK